MKGTGQSVTLKVAKQAALHHGLGTLLEQASPRVPQHGMECLCMECFCGLLLALYCFVTENRCCLQAFVCYRLTILIHSLNYKFTVFSTISCDCVLLIYQFS